MQLCKLLMFINSCSFLLLSMTGWLECLRFHVSNMEDQWVPIRTPARTEQQRYPMWNLVAFLSSLTLPMIPCNPCMFSLHCSGPTTPQTKSKFGHKLGEGVYMSRTLDPSNPTNEGAILWLGQWYVVLLAWLWRPKINKLNPNQIRSNSTCFEICYI